MKINRLLMYAIAQIIVGSAFVFILVTAFLVTKPTQANNTISDTQNIIYDQEGTGTFVSEKGYLITNNHVVTSDGKLSEFLYTVVYNKSYYLAKVVYIDRYTDLAILKIIYIKDILVPCLSTASEDIKKGNKYTFLEFNTNSNHEVLFRDKGFYDVIIAYSNVLIRHPIFSRQFSDISLPIVSYSGNSGSPLVNTNKDIVGILWGGTSQNNASVTNSGLISFISRSHLPIKCNSPDRRNPLETVVQIIGVFRGSIPRK